MLLGKFNTVYLPLFFALIAFSANSVLCRFALGDQAIDAASFTAVRLASGSLALFILLKFTQNHRKDPESYDLKDKKGSWLGASMLFIYAACFSFAYLFLDTATGALILFGMVQFTMISLTLYSGHRLTAVEWSGVILAFVGFVYLIWPDLNTPSAQGFVLMSISGVAWGIYSLLGRKSQSPLVDTTYNFLRSVPMVVLIIIIFYPQIHLSQKGLLLAILSGTLASGLGYSLWYMALKNLTATIASVSQLVVPIFAAAGGMLLISEQPSFRFMIAAFLILGGIALVIQKNKPE